MAHLEQFEKLSNASGQPPALAKRVTGFALSCWLAAKDGVHVSLALAIVFTALAALRAVAQYPGDWLPEGTAIPHPGGHRLLPAIPGDPMALRTDGTPTLTNRQKLYIIRTNFEKSKSDAAELAALAKELHQELNKPNVNVLSAEFTNRLDKIEKLAKKIRDETKGF